MIVAFENCGGIKPNYELVDESLPPYEALARKYLNKQGVDFWWLDWQQGGVTDIPGLDPLWMLNHVHYLDSGRERTRTGADGRVERYRRRPITFSRFADASSHRTPIDFSGDTVITWDSLRFQPEFTEQQPRLVGTFVGTRKHACHRCYDVRQPGRRPPP